MEFSQFAEDVLSGLSASPKWLSSKYFYDDEGSRLFQEIMKLPEYYLTETELEIFSTQGGQIFEAFGEDPGGFDLIELGAGDGTKTAVLVGAFLKKQAVFSYSPIDISQKALDALTAKFGNDFPALDIRPLTGDYFNILRTLKNSGGRRKVLMFLGSNIGNFSRAEAVSFFKQLRAVMNPDDQLFIGFDLQKDPRVIEAAYDDAAGVTAAFNLNLLARINRELNADFDLQKFSHYALYAPDECAARSFLISREDQTVSVEALGRSFRFDKWEAVFVEISQKYSLRMIGELASESGFAVVTNFFDSRRYYADSLWRPA
jgi:dimethylhistidine N-methyltransferase